MSESAINMIEEEADFHSSQDFDVTNLEFGDGSQCPQTIGEPNVQPTSTSRGGKKREKANEEALKAFNDIAKSIGSFVSETEIRMDKITNTLHVVQDVRYVRMSLDEELQKLLLDDDDRLSLLMEIGENDRILDIFFGLKDEVSRMRFVQKLLTRMQR